MIGRWLERTEVPGRQQEPPTAKGRSTRLLFHRCCAAAPGGLIAAAAGDTIAVNVRGCPALDGLSDDASVVLVVAWLTIWVIVGDVLAP